MNRAKRIQSTTVAEGRFLRLDNLTYEDASGRRRQWESVSRQHTPGAVFMVPILHPSERFVFIRQYRPPVDAHVLEFPAGLIDEGETVAEAGLRELREETGYNGVFRWLGPMVMSSPGMSDEAVALAVVDIDEQAPANRHPLPTPDENEDIEILLVPKEQVPRFLHERLGAGDRLDSRLMAYFMGMNLLPEDRT